MAVTFGSPWKCSNPGATRGIQHNRCHELVALNSQQFHFIAFGEIKSQLIVCYNVVPLPAFLSLQQLQELERNSRSKTARLKEAVLKWLMNLPDVTKESHFRPIIQSFLAFSARLFQMPRADLGTYFDGLRRILKTTPDQTKLDAFETVATDGVPPEVQHRQICRRRLIIIFEFFSTYPPSSPLVSMSFCDRFMQSRKTAFNSSRGISDKMLRMRTRGSDRLSK
jgi:hypothetical protein